MTKMSTHLPAALLCLLVLLALGAGAVESLLGTDGNAADLGSRYLSASAAHPLGTDSLGRDVLVRLLYGGRVSLGVGFAAALLIALIGTVIGMLAGYAGGKTDALLMRATDLLIALPLLPLLIVLSAIDAGKLGLESGADASLYKIILLIALTGWTTMARLVRSRTLVLKEADFVLAARALGLGHARIVLHHILPNLLGTVIIAAALAVGNIILIESVLSFLGLGIQPPTPSWGNMLAHAEDDMWERAALMVWPGVMIFVTVLSFNFLGDGLRGRLDPKRQK